MENKPLSGLKVLELASVLAGPAVGTFLAELGADVIKIENPKTGGDVTRSWKLRSEDPNAMDSAYFCSVNYGKKHEFYDLGDQEHLAKVQELAFSSDIIIANYRVGQAERFGLDFECIRKVNPSVIYGNIVGFEASDSRPAFDVALQAETGYMFMNGQPENEPTKMPVALIDVLAAHQMKEAILLALLKRERSGNGSYISVSLFDAAVSALANQASNWLMNGHIPQRIGSLHPNIAPYGEILNTMDNKQIVLAIGSDKQFRSLCQVLGLSELVTDPRFISNQIRVQNRAALFACLNAKAVQFSCEDLMKKLLEKAVPAGVIRNLQEVFELEQAKKMIITDGHSKRVSQIAFKLKR
jgi:crotonobetainyl-CoA:carnitine CoA-transferase CaiB-like acyl-CoA transferase